MGLNTKFDVRKDFDVAVLEFPFLERRILVWY